MLVRRLRLATAFARSWWSYVHAGSPRPVSAALAVTNRCNLRCAYCNTPFVEPDELPLATIEVLLDRLWQLGVRRLGITGGEPLLRPDIGGILEAAADRGFYVNLNTNLTLYERNAKAFSRLELVFTSLDGVSDAHEKNRGAQAREGVLAAIDALVAANKRVVAICVITEHNLDQVDPLLDLAARHGFKMHFQPQCHGTYLARGGPGQELTDAAQRALWRLVLARKKAGAPVASTTAYLQALIEWQDYHVVAIKDVHARCAGARGMLYVDPHGRAYPCTYTKGKAPGTDMLADDWRQRLSGDTPCTRCMAGAHLEFSLLYQRPLRSAFDVLGTYV